MNKGREFALRIKENIGQVIVGKDETISLLLTALISGGHVLLLDMPEQEKQNWQRALPRAWILILEEYSLLRTSYLPIF